MACQNYIARTPIHKQDMICCLLLPRRKKGHKDKKIEEASEWEREPIFLSFLSTITPSTLLNLNLALFFPTNNNQAKGKEEYQPPHVRTLAILWLVL